MDTQHQHKFILHGEALLSKVWLPVTIAGSRPKWGSGIIQCSISARYNGDEDQVLDQALDDWMHQGDRLDWLHRPLQLRGITESGKDFWVPKFRLKSFGASARAGVRSEKV